MHFCDLMAIILDKSLHLFRLPAVSLVRRHGAGAGARACSSAATFSQSLRDRQYTMPHATRPPGAKSRRMRAAISSTASFTLLFFLATSYLRRPGRA